MWRSVTRVARAKPMVVFAGVAGVFVLGILTTAFVHYSRTVAENDRLRNEKVVLETAIELQDQTIDRQAAAIDAWDEYTLETARRMDELRNLGQEARDETRRLNETFRRHDLEGLATARPGLIERRVNDASDRARRLLECASGASGPDC